MRSENAAEVRGVCSTGTPTGMLEIDDVRARLDSIEARLREARAAADVMAEGDASAGQELSSELDGMAEDIATLKTGLGSSFGS
jgi:hypothetical protein